MYTEMSDRVNADGFFLQGINLGVVAVTLPDMEVRTSSNTAEMSVVFIWIGVGTVVGTLVVGPLFDRVNGMLLLSATTLLAGVFAALGPMWQNLAAYQALVALMILFCSASITGTLWIIVSSEVSSNIEVKHQSVVVVNATVLISGVNNYSNRNRI